MQVVEHEDTTSERGATRAHVSQPKFELFVIYARADVAFVRNVLIPGIHLPAERVLLVDELTPGAPRVREIERGVSESRFTLAVLSPACLADGWATFGEQLASHLSVASPRIIPLYLSDCELPVHIDFRVALDFRREEDRPFELARLRQLLQTTAPPTIEPTQPLGPGAKTPVPHRAPLWQRRASWLGLAASTLVLAFIVGLRQRSGPQRPLPAPSAPGLASSLASAPAPALSAPVTPDSVALPRASGQANALPAAPDVAARDRGSTEAAAPKLDRARARAKLIELGFDATPAVLFERIMQGDSASVSLLLAAGMDPETLGHDPPYATWISALCLAARHDRAEVAKVLLAAGADLDSALPCASKDGNQVLRLFLARSPGEKAVLGALRSAATFGQPQALALLLPRLKDVSHEGGDALIAAATNSQLEPARALLDAGVPVDSIDTDGYSALLRASSSGRVETLDLLLARGADLARRGPAGETALHLAVSAKFDKPGLSDATVARLLLAKGADIRAKSATGETPIAWAIGRNPHDQDELIRLLVEHGADVNATDADGTATLFKVLNNTPLVAYLLDHGAHVDAKTSSGSTALLQATASAWFDAVQVLIDHGANPALRDASGQSALSAAAGLEPGERERMLLLLRETKKR